MKKYKYQFETYTNEDYPEIDLPDWLNKWGRTGWQVITLFNIQTSSIGYINHVKVLLMKEIK